MSQRASRHGHEKKGYMYLNYASYTMPIYFALQNKKCIITTEKNVLFSSIQRAKGSKQRENEKSLQRKQNALVLHMHQKCHFMLALPCSFPRK